MDSCCVPSVKKSWSLTDSFICYNVLPVNVFYPYHILGVLSTDRYVASVNSHSLWDIHICMGKPMLLEFIFLRLHWIIVHIPLCNLYTRPYIVVWLTRRHSSSLYTYRLHSAKMFIYKLFLWEYYLEQLIIWSYHRYIMAPDNFNAALLSVICDSV